MGQGAGVPDRPLPRLLGRLGGPTCLRRKPRTCGRSIAMFPPRWRPADSAGSGCWPTVRHRCGDRRRSFSRRNNPGHGRGAGAAIQRTLEDGRLGSPSGVRRFGRRHCGPNRDVVGIQAVGPGRRADHLARRRSRDVDGRLLVPPELPEPRPGYWSMRFMLIHDTVRAQSWAERS